MLGFTEILVIASVVIILYNIRRLPELGQSVGKSIKGFKKALNGEDDEKTPEKEVKRLDE